MSTTTTNNGTNGNAQENAALVKADAETSDESINVFASAKNYEAGLKMAKAFAASTLVPQAYQNNIPNVLIAMELASRIRASVFAVMQNIDIIHGRPSWRAKFLIATVNACGRFTALRWRWEGKKGTDEYGVRAWAKELSTGEECVGPLISWEVVKAEAWMSKSGSKWKTIPEKMFLYRSAAWWADVYAPELSLGMRTVEETIDAFGEDVTNMPAANVSIAPSELETALLAKGTATEPSSSPQVAPPESAPVVAAEKPARQRRSHQADPETGELPLGDPPRDPGQEG